MPGCIGEPNVRAVKIEGTYNTVDELEITRALRVTVSGTVLRTSLVAGVGGKTAIRRHLREVQSTIETAGQVGHIDVEGELLVKWLEDLVFGVAGHKVKTRSDIGLCAGGDEVELEGGTGGGHTVSTAVLSTIECAVGGAGSGVRTQGRVPLIASVAISSAAANVIS